ncbi:CUB domain-containing protein 1 [Hemicordylus capensis]|uniref:CUB domain-containing protein 1 n=1 Tax=Hemicordylus capensis TaxID=884348 RepID=UPI002303CD04|nr:CUB domain-containing protein 1 [Hemicordylus capensis]
MAAGWLTARVLAKLLLAAILILQGAAGALAFFLQPGDNITITIKSGAPIPQHCALCVGRQCVPELQINPREQKDFTFGCNTPHKYWVLVIQRNIDCTSGRCPFGEVLLQPSGTPLLNRTFTWDIKTNKTLGLELKFSTWLRQIMPGEACPNQVTYSIGTRLDAKFVNIGHFCTNGSVSRVKVQGGVIMTLQLPWDSKLTTSGLRIENRSAIQRLCIIESTFQNESHAVMMAANYPSGFPNDQLMTWQFVIPSNLRANVLFLNHTLANCEWQEQKVEYYLPDAKREVYSLNMEQPVNIPGRFNLTLQSCHQDSQNPGSLTLMFKVVIQYPQNEKNVTYTIDLSKEKDMNVTIYSQTPYSGYHLMNEPLCLICLSVRKCKSNVTLFSGDKYSIMFLCRDVEKIRIIGEQSRVCHTPKTCQMITHHLVVPRALTQLPIQLETFTWKLSAPEAVNIEIRSPTLKLHQSIPNQTDQKCTGSYSYTINGTTPKKAFSLGLFCPGRAIEKIQMRNNVTITLKTYGKRFFSDSSKQDLQMSFMPGIQEECIFTVTPDPQSTVFLQTPNWVEGLPPHMSVYWNISVPPKQTAQLAFINDRMGVTCESGRANIYIQEQSPKAEETVRRDDQLLPKTLDMSNNFWINITNCKPAAKQQLSVQFKMTFHKKAGKLAAIIGAVFGGIAVLVAIGLVIYCVKKKRKKENPTPMVGVYNSNVNTQMPGKPGKFKKRKNNESHVYAVIDDVMVYGHLLDASSRPENAEIGVYRPFSGPVSTLPPSPPPIRKISKVSNPEESSFIPLTDNETYTFAHRAPEEPKSNGDINVSGNGNVSSALLEKSGQENSVE